MLNARVQTVTVFSLRAQNCNSLCPCAESSSECVVSKLRSVVPKRLRARNEKCLQQLRWGFCELCSREPFLAEFAVGFVVCLTELESNRRLGSDRAFINSHSAQICPALCLFGVPSARTSRATRSVLKAESTPPNRSREPCNYAGFLRGLRAALRPTFWFAPLAAFVREKSAVAGSPAGCSPRSPLQSG